MNDDDYLTDARNLITANDARRAASTQASAQARKPTNTGRPRHEVDADLVAHEARAGEFMLARLRADHDHEAEMQGHLQTAMALASAAVAQAAATARCIDTGVIVAARRGVNTALATDLQKRMAALSAATEATRAKRLANIDARIAARATFDAERKALDKEAEHANDNE